MLFNKFYFLKNEIEGIGATGSLHHSGTVYSLIDDWEEKPEKKLRNAKESFGQSISNDETLLLLFDTTFFGSATDGIIFTDKRIYAKESFCDPFSVDYQDIIDVKSSRETGDITLTCKNGTQTLKTSVTDYFLLWSLSQFILGYSAIIKAHHQGIELDTRKANELYDEVCWYCFTNVEKGSSLFSDFFDKYGSIVMTQLSTFTLAQLESDQTWDFVIDKLYEFLPAPVRIIVSKEQVKNMIISNKSKIIEHLNS